MTKEEMEKQIHDFAKLMYKTGYEDGQKDWHNVDEEREKAYKQGLNDAWECAKNIINSYNCNWSDSTPKYADIFGEYLTVHLFDISASEAIAKIKEYEEQQKPKFANCSILNDECAYPYITCDKCEVHCSVERAKQKLKGDKE